MVARKPHKLPVCRHVQIGAQLQEAREMLLYLSIELSNTYPKTSRQAQVAHRAQDAVDRLRHVLDDVSAGELPGDDWSPTIYYGANRDVREADVSRILKAHQADDPPCCADEGDDRGR